MNFFSISVNISHCRVFQSDYPEQIGHWICCCTALDPGYSRMTSRCVVDDFGDLVPVA